MQKFRIIHSLLTLVVFSTAITGCGEVEPPAPENEEEIINKVTLSFSPINGGVTLAFTAFDPDGQGPDPIEIDNIVLEEETIYELELKLEDTFTDSDITPEIRNEGDAHQFFFGWSDGLFDSPQGDGNIENRKDPVNYKDVDVNGLPIGLETEWHTKNKGTGTLRVLLKHQPNIKSENSTAQDGATDSDITFNVGID